MVEKRDVNERTGTIGSFNVADAASVRVIKAGIKAGIKLSKLASNWHQGWRLVLMRRI